MYVSTEIQLQLYTRLLTLVGIWFGVDTSNTNTNTSLGKQSVVIADECSTKKGSPFCSAVTNISLLTSANFSTHPNMWKKVSSHWNDSSYNHSGCKPPIGSCTVNS